MTQRTIFERYLLVIDNPTFENIIRQITVQEMITLCGLTTEITRRCEPYWPVKYKQLYGKEEMLYPNLTPKDPWKWNILEMGLYGFGKNDKGKLGLGDKPSQPKPQRILDRSFRLNRTNVKIVQVSAGVVHTVCLDENGNVWTFGSNLFGQLGLGYTSELENPQRINPNNFRVGQQLMRITQVSAGIVHTVCLDEIGNVWAFGRNIQGALGLGEKEERFYSEPHRIPSSRFDNLEITQISIGDIHTVCIDENKNVWTFGDNSTGQLGLGYTSEQENTPQLIPRLHNIVQVSAGNGHTVCLDKDGNVWAFGWNPFGHLGLGQTFRIRTVATPRQVTSLHRIIQISAGDIHTVCLDEDGIVWGFGENSGGQLGLGVFERIVDTPRRIDPSHFSVDGQSVRITQVSAGDLMTVCIDEEGNVWTFGRNYSGQLGLGYTSERENTPQLIPYRAVKVSAGQSYTMLIGMRYPD